MRHKYFFLATILSVVLCAAGRAQQPASPNFTARDANQSTPAMVKAQALLPSAPEPRDKGTSTSSGDMDPAEVNGTVTDTNGDLIPGATDVLMDCSG